MRRRLMNTPYVHISENNSVILSVTRLCIENVKYKVNRMDHMIAIIRFAKGPAKATKNIPLFLFLKLYGLTGTGFAHPNTKPPKYISKPGNITVPNKSIWAMGLSVRRPCLEAVKSPKPFAIRPCATS